MKFLVISFHLFFLPHEDSIGQTTYSGEAPDVPWKYRKTAHSISIMPAVDQSQAIKLMNGFVDAIKSVYPKPVESEIGPYGGDWKDYRGNAEFSNGPYIVHLTVPFLELLPKRTGEIAAGEEFSSSIEIWVNWAKFILQSNRSASPDFWRRE